VRCGNRAEDELARILTYRLYGSSGVFRNLKGGQGYISGVRFQKCSNSNIFPPIKIVHFYSPSREEGGASPQTVFHLDPQGPGENRNVRRRRMGAIEGVGFGEGLCHRVLVTDPSPHSLLHLDCCACAFGAESSPNPKLRMKPKFVPLLFETRFLITPRSSVHFFGENNFMKHASFFRTQQTRTSQPFSYHLSALSTTG